MRLACFSLVLFLIGALPGAQQTRHFSDADLEPLARGLDTYFKARESAVGLEESEATVASELAVLGQLPGGGYPMRFSRDVGRAHWLSKGLEKRKLRKGKIVEEVLSPGSYSGIGLEFAYRLPKDYDSSEGSYPLILTIPDADEEPAGHLRSHWITREVLNGAILLSPVMPAVRAEWDQVQVNGRPGGLSHVLSALRLAKQWFAVDPERVFVVGRGKGVPAAVAVGNYSPQAFAGIIGRAGDAGELGPFNFSNLPTYFTGAGANATAFQRAHQGAGFDNCELASDGDESSVWEWMLEHPRVTYPSEVTLVVGQPFPTRAYWLRVAPLAADARAHGAIDRDTNTIRIESEGVSLVTLYLNDELIDLGQDVHIVCNEVERTLAIERHLPTMLELLFDGTSGSGSTYVAEAFVDAMGKDAASAAPGAASDPEFDSQVAAAEGDPEALWELFLQCEAPPRAARGGSILRRILRTDPDHAQARAALGQVNSGDFWFLSKQSLERYLLGQDEEQAEAKGYVHHKLGWIHPDERSRANKGWEKDWPTGQWFSGADQRRLNEGWMRQDLNWIAPEDARHMDDGLWLIDGEWLDLGTANRRHAKIDHMWRIPSPEVLLYSTADRDVSLRAMENMARAVEDLRKVFGAQPVLPLGVAVLRDEEQYDRFAFGDPDGRRLPTDFSRLHVVHSAFFAEGWYPRVDGKRTFRGMGVCYWDPLIPYGDRYGVHSARLALGLSYVEALDPSPKTVKKVLSKGTQDGYHTAFEAEKKLPAWLRFGGAVYAERYFFDSTAEGDADPWWARQWSRDNLRSRGGLRPLDEVLNFEIDPGQREDGQKLLLEAGLLVAFIVDGKCEPVDAAHAEFKRSLASGSVSASAVKALTKALIDHEIELRVFAEQ